MNSVSSIENPSVSLRQLKKVYIVNEQESGARAALRGLLHRRKVEVNAVDGISFDVKPGEVVGFLGPNGAGKTTTLKMLSGLLYPTSGEASVLGFVPWRRERAYLRQMTLVMGQRNQLIWDIPALSTVELNRVVYGLAQHDYESGYRAPAQNPRTKPFARRAYEVRDSGVAAAQARRCFPG
jgi:ABC-2 type transport system ATP-binding protein